MTIIEWKMVIIAARADHEKRQAIAVAKAWDKLKSASKVLVTPAQDDVQEVFEGMARSIRGEELTTAYKAVAVCQTALRQTPAIMPIRNALRAEFPRAFRNRHDVG
jgi:hypothetical protein